MLLKINLQKLDVLILSFLSYVVFIDMINGFFMIEYHKLPISQTYKIFLLILILFRLSFTKDFSIILILLLVFQLGPIQGLVVSGDFSSFVNDVIVSTKWFNVPLSFFYFKNIFLKGLDQKMTLKIRKFIRSSFKFILLNMLIGFLGFGMAFYNHGYNNAVGTRGYIFAGNELTILVLAIGFLIAVYFFEKKNYKKYFFSFLIFLIISFLITSKTVLGGVIIIFLIPVISNIRIKFKKKWLNYIVATLTFGVPMLLFLLSFGILYSGVIDKINYSLQRNNYEIVTVLLSNRNNFLEKGWEVYTEEFSFLGKLLGYGQNYHLQLSGHLAEIDFFSLLFASGILGLLFLFLLIFYWFANAIFLKKQHKFIYAKSVLIFLWFIVIAANLSGHIFGSGIAGFFIGLAIALMFYKNKNDFLVSKNR